MRYKTEKRQGRCVISFTLIELLVVISIIAILASILLPSLKKAKGKANEIACFGQMRQLGLMAVNYTGDNDEYILPNNTANTSITFWATLLRPYYNFTPPQSKYDKYFVCTADPEPGAHAWLAGALFSYSYSYALGNAYGLGMSPGYKPYMFKKCNFFKTPSQVGQLSEADATCKTWPLLPWYLSDFSAERYIDFRHAGRAPVLHLDGTVRSYNMSQMVQSSYDLKGKSDW